MYDEEARQRERKYNRVIPMTQSQAYAVAQSLCYHTQVNSYNLMRSMSLSVIGPS